MKDDNNLLFQQNITISILLYFPQSRTLHVLSVIIHMYYLNAFRAFNNIIMLRMNIFFISFSAPRIDGILNMFSLRTRCSRNARKSGTVFFFFDVLRVRNVRKSLRIRHLCTRACYYYDYYFVVQSNIYIDELNSQRVESACYIVLNVYS